jgi:hypothetical protein
MSRSSSKRRIIVAGARKCLPNRRGDVLNESATAADLEFQQQRLAFMHRSAEGVAHRLVTPVDGQSLLIERMAGFVADRHQRFEKTRLVIARGNPGIVRHAAAERNRGFTQRPLIGYCERTLERQGCGLSAQHPVEQRRQKAFQIIELFFDMVAAQLGFISFEQRIVRVEVHCIGKRAGAFATQSDDFFQERLNASPVIPATRFPPGLFTVGCGQGVRLHQLGRYRGGSSPLTIDLIDIGVLPGIKPFVTGLCQQLAYLRRRTAFVDQTAERCQRFRASCPTTRRHHAGLVPSGDRAEFPKSAQIPLFCLELRIRAHCGASAAGVAVRII